MNRLAAKVQTAPSTPLAQHANETNKSDLRNDYNNFLEYEIKTLKEIYKLLFPGFNIIIFLKSVNQENVRRPQEINIHCSNDLLMVAQTASTVVRIEHAADAPQRMFLITGDFRDCADDAPEETVQITGLRKFLTNFPLVYELIKYNYLKTKEKICNYKRLLCVDNPKNKFLTPFFKRTIGMSKKSGMIAMHWLDVGGAEAFAKKSCDLMTKSGIEAIIVVAHISKRFYFKSLYKQHSIYEVDRQVPVGLEVLFVQKISKLKNISIIHNHHNIYVYEALPALKILENPPVIIDTLHIDEKKRYEGGFPRISIVWSNFIDFHHVISVRLKKILLSHGLHAQRVVFGRLGQSIACCTPFNIEKNIRKKITFLYVGRMSSQKRPLLAAALMMKAVKLCKNIGLSAECHVIGDGLYAPAFRAAVAAAGMRGVFHFHPAHADVEAAMKKSDLLLISSENEGITLVAYEALRNGCMVVSTDVGAQNELLPPEALLPADPFAVYMQWPKLLRNLLLDDAYRHAVWGSTVAYAEKMNCQPTAETVCTGIYSEVFA